MPLPVPTLDDRRFDDLVAEARALIPSGSPAWTNHNPSDPGITLLELLAYVTEALIYRLDRVTPDTIGSFLNLIDGQMRVRGAMEGRDLTADIRHAITKLRTPDRAITCDDFERLALQPAALEEQHRGSIARVHCVPCRNLEPGQDPEAAQVEHVSVIVVPVQPPAAPEEDASAAEVRGQVFRYLDERRLLGTRVHVVGPTYASVDIEVEVRARRDQREPGLVKQDVVRAITDFLNAQTGGADGRGWPFGRPVFLSELYALVSRLQRIDDVTNITLTPPAGRDLIYDGSDHQVVGFGLRPHELVAAKITVKIQ